MRIFLQEYHILLLYKSLDLGKGHVICGLVITRVCPVCPSFFLHLVRSPLLPGTDLSTWSRHDQSEHLVFLITVII